MAYNTFKEIKNISVNLGKNIFSYLLFKIQ
jgi:hypothetical protein